MTIYLFCNQRFGTPFLETAARFAAETDTAIRVVLSAGRRNRSIPQPHSAAPMAEQGRRLGAIYTGVIDRVR